MSTVAKKASPKSPAKGPIFQLRAFADMGSEKLLRQFTPELIKKGWEGQLRVAALEQNGHLILAIIKRGRRKGAAPSVVLYSISDAHHKYPALMEIQFKQNGASKEECAAATQHALVELEASRISNDND